MVDECDRLRNIQIGSYDANQDEILLTVTKISRANCSLGSDDGQFTSDSFISLINNYGQGQWEIKLEGEKSNSRFLASFIGDSSLLIVEKQEDTKTLNLIALDKASGEVLNAQELTAFGDSSSLFGVSVIKASAKDQDKYYIAATKVAGEAQEPEYTLNICKVSSALSVEHCFTIETLSVSSSPTILTGLGFTDSMTILVLDNDDTQLHHKTLVLTSGETATSVLSLKYPAEIVMSQFMTMEDGKRWVTLDVGIENLWISHGLIENGQIKLVSQTQLNIRGYNAKLHSFNLQDKNQIFITMVVDESQSIGYIVFSLDSNTVANTGLFRTTSELSSLTYVSYTVGQDLVFGYSSKGNQKVSLNKLTTQNKRDLLQETDSFLVRTVDTTKSVTVISESSQSVHILTIKGNLSKKINRKAVHTNTLNINTLSASEEISTIQTPRNLALSTACQTKMDGYYPQTVELTLGSTPLDQVVTSIDINAGSPSFDDCVISVEYSSNDGSYVSFLQTDNGNDVKIVTIDTTNEIVQPGFYPILIKFQYDSATLPPANIVTLYRVQYIRIKPYAQYAAITNNMFQESCSNRATYPKVIGWDDASSQIYGSDSHPSDANTIGICGMIDPKAMKNQFFFQDRRRGIISQTNPSGKFDWTYTVTDAKNMRASFFTSCVYRVYNGKTMFTGLVHLPQSQENSLVQFESSNGLLLQTVLVPGSYKTTIYYNKLFKGYNPIDMIVTGMRTDDRSMGIVQMQVDHEFTQRGFSSSHKIVGNTETFAIHDVVSTARTNIYTAYLETNEGANSYQVLYHQDITTGAQPSLVKQIDFAASIGEIDQVRYSLAVDASTYTLYWSSGSYVASNSSIVKTLRKFDVFDDANTRDIFDLQATRSYSVSLANGLFISDLVFQNNQVYEQFTVSETRYYIVIYQSDLTIKTIKSFFNANFEISQLSILPTGATSFFSILTTKHAVSDIYHGTLVDRFDNDITRATTSCLYWNDNTVVFSSAIQTGVQGAQSLSSITYATTSNQLTPFSQYDQLYFEYKFDTIDMYYRQVQQSGCTLKGLNQLQTVLPEKVFFFSNTANNFKFNVELPQVCITDALAVTVTVDNEATLPSYITYTRNSTFLRFDLSNADSSVIGKSISIRIKYTVGSFNKEQVQLVNFYPQYHYGAAVERFECADLGMQYFQGASTSEPRTFQEFSISDDGQAYVLCGHFDANSGQNKHAFINQYSLGNAVLFSQSYQFTTQVETVDCGYHGNEEIYFITQSNPVLTGIYSRINFLHMDTNAVLLRSRSLEPHTGQGFEATAVQIYPERNLLFIGGQTTSQAIGATTQSIWVTMINTVNFEVVFFKVFTNQRYYTSYLFKGFAYDEDNSRIFINQALENDQGEQTWGAMLIDDSTGAIKWSKVQGDGSFAYVIKADMHKQVNQIYYDDRYYSCSISDVGKQGFPGDGKYGEAAITLFNTNGDVVYTYEMSSGSLASARTFQSCYISRQIAENRIALAVQDDHEDQGKTWVLLFDATITSSIEYASLQVIKQTVARDNGHVRIAYVNSKLNVFITGRNKFTSFDTGFALRLQAQNLGDDNFNWYHACSTISLVENQATTSPQLLQRKEGAYQNLKDYWVDGSDYQISRDIDAVLINSKFTTIQGLLSTTSNYTSSDDLRKVYQASICPYVAAPVIGSQEDYTGADAKIVQKDLYRIDLVKPKQCQNYDLSYQLTFNPTGQITKFLNYDSANQYLYVDADNNTLDGTYNLLFSTSVDILPTKTDSDEFSVEVERNYPPLIKSLVYLDATVLIYNDQVRYWKIEKLSDDKNDTSNWDVEVWKKNSNGTYTNVNSTVNWLTLTQYSDASYTFRVYNTPVPATGTMDIYRIRVYVSDDLQNDKKERYTDITLLIKENIRPNFKTGVATSQSIRIIQSFDRTFTLNDFSDFENDTYSMTFKQIVKPATAPANALDWLTVDIDNDVQEIHVYGETPRDNTYKGNYLIQIELTDIQGGPTRVVDFTLNVLENKQIDVIEIDDIPILREMNIQSYDLTTNCVDTQGDAIRYTLYINGTDFYTLDYSLLDIFSYENDTQIFELDFDYPEQGGNHSISLKCEDYVNSPVWVNWTIEALYNFPIVINTPIPEQEVFYKSGSISIDLSQYIEDPEHKPISYTAHMNDVADTPIPILFRDSNNNAHTGAKDPQHPLIYTFSFIGAQKSDAQTYNLKFKMYDQFVNQLTEISFELTLLGCAGPCEECSGPLVSQCTECKDSYIGPDSIDIPWYLEGTTCMSHCPSGKYGSDTGVCTICSSECQTCDGPSREQNCDSCKTGFFYSPVENGCFKTCPFGYYPDPDAKQCVQAIDDGSQIPQPIQVKLLECNDFVRTIFDISQELRIPESFDQFESRTVSCSGMQTCFGGVQNEATCTWERKLNAQCNLNYKTGTVTISVTTNSMPDHCFSTANNIFPTERFIQFEVAYDIPYSKLKKLNFGTQKLVDSVLCDDDWTIDSAFRPIYEYKGQVTNPSGVVGIAANGVPIYQGTSEFKYDAFSPKAYSVYKLPRIIGADTCLGSVGNTGFYKYYAYSPCIIPNVDPETEEEYIDVKGLDGERNLCSEDGECQKGIESYINKVTHSVYKKALASTPIGIARDGHHIYGPFKNEAGALWQPCDLDICNGFYDEENDRYSYAMTLFHPYTIGCFGPANEKEYVQSCTSNTKVCVASPQTGSFAITNLLNGSLQIFITLFAILSVAML